MVRERMRKATRSTAGVNQPDSKLRSRTPARSRAGAACWLSAACQTRTRHPHKPVKLVDMPEVQALGRVEQGHDAEDDDGSLHWQSGSRHGC